jgi:hypothetical protein
LKPRSAKQSVPLLVVDGRARTHLSREDVQRHFTETAASEPPVEVVKAELRVETERGPKFPQQMFVAIRLLVEMV